jgi:ElaB/YqjD/DUF883 family membrane-anchored ribosome-binding protein
MAENWEWRQLERRFDRLEESLERDRERAREEMEQVREDKRRRAERINEWIFQTIWTAVLAASVVYILWG